MAVYLLSEELIFPNPSHAGNDGLLAVGGDLRPERLILAYRNGIFPWFSPDDPIMWWSPDPRCVLSTHNVKISKSMRNVLNQKKFKVIFDQKFEEVMRRCMEAKRKESGTWIGEDMIGAYLELYKLGFAHSVEVYENDILVGGLYGVSIGKMFFGESMFSSVSNASKVGLITLSRVLAEAGFDWIDCQLYTPHLGTMGAEVIDRRSFLELLTERVDEETIRGKWEIGVTQTKLQAI